jgi:hypothetical protein
MNSKALLICNVSEGMFPDERTVTFQASDGCRVELFVTKQRITPDNKLEVTILEEKNGLSLIRLPAEPLNESAVLTVRSNMIKKLITA